VASRPVLVSLLSGKTDRLLELRTLLRTLQAEERRLTEELVAAMTAQGLGALHGLRAVASVEHREGLRIDPELFLIAAGTRAPQALTVSVMAARRILGEAELEAISETVTTAALRVEPIREVAG
jgi:hypothetical protein